MKTDARAGTEIGITTRQNVMNGDAPSIDAESNRSLGMAAMKLWTR
jgi:hypothetical protein